MNPRGSVLAEPCLGPDTYNGPYEVEGIGYEFQPTVLSYESIDMWVCTDDMEAFDMARRLIRSEGLLVGAFFFPFEFVLADHKAGEMLWAKLC